MLGVAEATSHGAISLVNAMATGKGAALGVKLWTKATVRVTEDAGVFIARNLSDPEEPTTLATVTARQAFARCGAAKRFGAIIETESNIPVAVGLKSSSAASNAVALASLHAIGARMSDLQTIRLGVEASLKTGVTLTGAYDDACACYFGGIVITDNRRRRILKRMQTRARLRVLIHVPKAKRYSRDIEPGPLRVIRPFVNAAHQEALRGNYWNSLTLNGLSYSIALGYDIASSTVALDAGAIAAGLTGKGPAVAAIVTESNRDVIYAAWPNLKGMNIDTSINSRKATPLRLVR